MDDKLTDRLRGKYKVGPEGVYETRDFSGFTPPICVEAAERIEQLEEALALYIEGQTNLVSDVFVDEQVNVECVNTVFSLARIRASRLLNSK